jgi:hypothetical protein
MKKIVISATLLFGLLIVTAQTKIKRTLPEANLSNVVNNIDKFLKFDKLEHEFGKLKKGPAVIATFVVTNISNQPFLITEVKPGCGCTTPDWPRGPIAPGKTAIIKASFDTNKADGDFRKYMTVITNQGNKELFLKGVILKKK